MNAQGRRAGAARGLTGFLAVTAIAAACVERVADRPGRSAFPVVWSPELRLASVSGVPQRLSTPTPDTAEFGLFNIRCPTDTASTARCVDVAPFTTTTCDEFSAREAAGYGARANPDYTHLSWVGMRCAAIRAVGAARPARRSAVRTFALTPAAIDSLPPVLGLLISDDEVARGRRDAARGIPWTRSDPGLTAAVDTEPPFRGALRVEGPYESTRVQVLGRGDFDGDGWDDLLVESSGRARGGTYIGIGLYVLTRTAPGTQLRVARELW